MKYGVIVVRFQYIFQIMTATFWIFNHQTSSNDSTAICVSFRQRFLSKYAQGLFLRQSIFWDRLNSYLTGRSLTHFFSHFITFWPKLSFWRRRYNLSRLLKANLKKFAWQLNWATRTAAWVHGTVFKIVLPPYCKILMLRHFTHWHFPHSINVKQHFSHCHIFSLINANLTWLSLTDLG